MTVRHYQEAHFPFLDYELHEAQKQFSRLPQYSIVERGDLEDPLKTPVTILYEDRPVGYFVLDRGSDRLLLTDEPKSLLLRTLSVHPEFQGKGIAKKAMLETPEFIRLNFLDIKELVLTVNCRNAAAYQLYITTGFLDAGKKTGGRHGPQHILSKKI